MVGKYCQSHQIIMADTSTSGQISRAVRSNLSKWDTAGESLAPISDVQRDCLLELTSFASKRATPPHVS